MHDRGLGINKGANKRGFYLINYIHSIINCSFSIKESKCFNFCRLGKFRISNFM